jgi:ribosomal protein S18 acetylase RimI-like enzyme
VNELRAVTADELAGPLLGRVVDLWTRAHGIRRGSPLWQEFGEERLPRHSRREGFVMEGAFDERDQLQGFVYGYPGAPGQWWHDRVAAALAEEVRREWLDPPHFELAELAVDPQHQGRGIGSRLHDAVLERQPHDRAVLSALAGNSRVIRFYEDRGWHVILPELRFEPDRPSFAILAKPLQR